MEGYAFQGNGENVWMRSEGPAFDQATSSFPDFLYEPEEPLPGSPGEGGAEEGKGNAEKDVSTVLGGSPEIGAEKKGLKWKSWGPWVLGTVGGAAVLAILIGLMFVGLKNRQGQVKNQKKVEDELREAKDKARERNQQPDARDLPAECEVPKGCEGIDCAPFSLKCLNFENFKGIRPSSGSKAFPLPSGRMVFSFPFEGTQIILKGNRGLAADINGFMYLKKPSNQPFARWSYDGRRLWNEETKEFVTAIEGTEVALLPENAKNPNQNWVFDGQRIYLESSLTNKASEALLYIGLDPEDEVLMLNEGKERDIYIHRPKEKLRVQYVPPYQYRNSVNTPNGTPRASPVRRKEPRRERIPLREGPPQSSLKENRVPQGSRMGREAEGKGSLLPRAGMDGEDPHGFQVAPGSSQGGAKKMFQYSSDSVEVEELPEAPEEAVYDDDDELEGGGSSSSRPGGKPEVLLGYEEEEGEDEAAHPALPSRTSLGKIAPGFSSKAGISADFEQSSVSVASKKGGKVTGRKMIHADGDPSPLDSF